jgi:hypothetical protein
MRMSKYYAICNYTLYSQLLLYQPQLQNKRPKSGFRKNAEFIRLKYEQ